MNNDIEFLTAEELSALVRVPLKWVRTYSHRIPGYTKIGRLVRYKKTSVLAALATGKLLKK